MEQDKTTRVVTGMIFLISLYLFLEGSGLTSFSNGEKNAPGFVLILAGFIFMMTGITIMFRNNARLNSLFASILTAAMGVVGGWVSVFSDDSGFTSNDMFLSAVTNIPLDRIMFGFGSLVSFLVSAYAFSLFVKHKAIDK